MALLGRLRSWNDRDTPDVPYSLGELPALMECSLKESIQLP
jgi:hypothetical protein